MAEFALILLVAVVLVMVIIGVTIGAGAWQVARRNRLAPDLETGAPLTWLWSPTQPARLHRRLRTAVVPVHLPIPKGRRGTKDATRPRPPIGIAATTDDICHTITAEAVAIDRELIIAARLPRTHRRPQVRALSHEVLAIEQLSMRIGRQRHVEAQPVAMPGDPPVTRRQTLDAVAGHLDALAEAHDELRAIDRSHGLDDPERVLGMVKQPSQPVPVEPPPMGPPVPGPAPPGDRTQGGHGNSGRR